MKIRGTHAKIQLAFGPNGAFRIGLKSQVSAASQIAEKLLVGTVGQLDGVPLAQVPRVYVQLVVFGLRKTHIGGPFVVLLFELILVPQRRVPIEAGAAAGVKLRGVRRVWPKLIQVAVKRSIVPRAYPLIESCRKVELVFRFDFEISTPACRVANVAV